MTRNIPFLAKKAVNHALLPIVPCKEMRFIECDRTEINAFALINVKVYQLRDFL